MAYGDNVDPKNRVVAIVLVGLFTALLGYGLVNGLNISIVKKLAEKFDMDYGWDGDILNFSRSGVDGHIALEAKELHVHAKLGFLTAMFKEPIESEIKRVLKEKF